MPDATGSRVRIHYEVVGAGPPLVLHPGFAQSGAGWASAGYVDALKGQHTLVLLDPRGQGASDKPHETAMYSTEARVTNVLAVVDALDIDRAHFWGYSLGGLVGYALGFQAPQRLRSLVIGAARPVAFQGNPTWAALLRQGMEMYVTEGVERPMGPIADAAVRARWLAGDAEALAAAVLVTRPSREAELATLALPLLLYCGDQDPAYERVKGTAELLPRATFVPLPGLNHLTGFFRSDAALPHVTAFLERVDAGAAPA